MRAHRHSDGKYTDYSNVAFATTQDCLPNLPVAPSNLTATAVSRTQINLAWRDNSNNEAGFRIFRGGTEIGTVGANAQSYQDTTCRCGTDYSYYIEAYSAAGNSTPSNTASATTQACPDVPAAPSGLTARADSRTQISLAWQDNADNESGFRIFRGGTEIGTAGANAQSYQDNTCHCGDTYSYYVKAYNDAGDSPASNTANATTHSCPPNVCPAPANLRAQAQSQSSIRLDWEDNCANETGFKIFRNGAHVGTAPGGQRSWTDMGLECRTEYSYHVVAVNPAGDSPASSAVRATTQDCQAVDSGFRPNPNGYRFGFWTPSTDDEARQEFSPDDLKNMIGTDCVCIGSESGFYCYLSETRKVLYEAVRDTLKVGHCLGMCATSLRFFKSIGEPPSYYQGLASNTYDLGFLSKIKSHIAYYHIQQYFVRPTVAEPRAVLSTLRAAILERSANLPILCFSGHSGGCGHCVVPYKLEDRGNGVWLIKIYNPNHKNDPDRDLVINTDANLWSYVYEFGCDWRGDGTTNNLAVYRLAAFGLHQLCPYSQGSSSLEVWMRGNGHLLITDSGGHRIGYVGEQLVSEVPAGEVWPILGGLGVRSEPIYRLPLTDTYAILLDGQTLTQTETAEVTQFGPGYALSVDEVPLDPSTRDHLAFASDGSQLTYTASGNKEVNLTLAHDGADTSDGFYVKGADVGAGQTVELRNDVAGGRLALDNAQGSSGNYNLEIARINTTWGERTFTHTDMDVAASDTQYLQYGSWDGSGPMTMLVDHGSDGTVDETVTLENQRVQALAGGWDLISLPLAPTSTAITVALASIAGHYDQVYAYDATDAADPWKLYDVARPSFLNDLAQVNERMGLWVHTSAPLTLTVSGRAPFSTTIPFVEGWNLVGYPGQVTRPITEALASIAGKYNLVQTYDAAESRWLTYDVSMPPFLNDLTEMVPGKGYWLVVTEDCVWNVE